MLATMAIVVTALLVTFSTVGALYTSVSYPTATGRVVGVLTTIAATACEITVLCLAWGAR